MYVVDGESFTPLVFPTFGCLGKVATIFYNRPADLLSQKHNTSYHQTPGCVAASVISTELHLVKSWVIVVIQFFVLLFIVM